MTHDEYMAALDRTCRWGTRAYHLGRVLIMGSFVTSIAAPWRGIIMAALGLACLLGWHWSCGHVLTLMKRHLRSL